MCIAEQYGLVLSSTAQWKHPGENALCKATIGCSFGSHSVTRSGSGTKTLPHSLKYSIVSPPFTLTLGGCCDTWAFSMALTAVFHRLMDVLGVLWSYWISFNSSSDPSPQPHSCHPLSCFHQPLALHVNMCAPLKLTCLSRLTALHGERESWRELKADR